MGLRAMIPGSVQLVGRNCQGPGPGVRSLISPGARLEIWELPAHRVLKVSGMMRAEGLHREKLEEKGGAGVESEEAGCQAFYRNWPAGEAPPLTSTGCRKAFQSSEDLPSVQDLGDHQSMADGSITGQSPPWLYSWG